MAGDHRQGTIVLREEVTLQKNANMKMTKCAAFALAFAVVCGSTNAEAHCPAFGGGIGIAGPITTFSAATLPEGKGVLGIRGEYTRFDPLAADQLSRIVMDGQTGHSLENQTVYSLGGAYGIGDDLTVGLSLPYLRRDGITAVHFDRDMGMSMQHDIGESNGLGDLTLYGQYRLVRKLYEGIDLSLIAGLKTPTGATGNTSNNQRIETEHQPGSGSWDPLVGIALSKRIERLSLHASGLYTITTQGSQSTDLGNRAQVSVAAAYRFGGKENHGECDDIYEYFYPESRDRWLGDLVLELNGQWQDKMQVRGVSDASTGGTVLYLSPGGRVSFDGKYSASLSVGVPVYQQLHGNQSEVDYRIVAGLAVAF
jgi:hypothetical protein